MQNFTLATAIYQNTVIWCQEGLCGSEYRQAIIQVAEAEAIL